MFMLFLLRPLTKPCYRDVTMHAKYFISKGKVKTLRRECPTCDGKRGAYIGTNLSEIALQELGIKGPEYL